MNDTARKTQPIKLHCPGVPSFTTDMEARFEFARKPKPGDAIRVTPHSLVGETYHEGFHSEGIPALGACIVKLTDPDLGDPRCDGGCD